MIEKNIKIPETFEIIKELQINESIFIKIDPILKNKIVASASYYGKRYKKKFITRYIKDGVRVWRIE